MWVSSTVLTFYTRVNKRDIGGSYDKICHRINCGGLMWFLHIYANIFKKRSQRRCR